MKLKTLLLTAAATLTAVSTSPAVIIYTEDFDGAGTLGFTTEDTAGTTVAQFTDGGGDYFTLTDGSNIGGGFVYTGTVGNFFGAQDLDGDGNPAVLRLRIAGIDVTGYTNLSLSINFAEDDDGTNQDWDDGDFVHANLSLDTVNGGADNDPSLFGIWFEGSGGTNTAPFIDADFDGVGEGAELTDAFTTFSKSFSQTGTTAGILITFALEAGDEDIAIDSITLSGDLVPEPSAAILGALGSLLFLRRRR